MKHILIPPNSGIIRHKISQNISACLIVWHFFSPFCLNPSLSLEIPHKYDGDSNGKSECKWESPPCIFHSVDEVHAEEAGYQSGEHEYDTDTGEHLHHSTHVVVDDVGIGIHGGVEDVGIDVGGLPCLTHLDVYVLYHVCIQFVDGEFELQFRKQVFISSDRSDEIGETVLQSAEGYQIGIVHVAVQVLLSLVDEGAYLLESLQIPYGRGKEETENHD